MAISISIVSAGKQVSLSPGPSEQCGAQRGSSFIRSDPSERSALLYFCPGSVRFLTLSNKISYHLGGSFSLVKLSFGAIQSHLPFTSTNFSVCALLYHVCQSNCTNWSFGTSVQPCSGPRTDAA